MWQVTLLLKNLSFHIIIAILRTKKEPDCSGTGLMIDREWCDIEERKRMARSARRRGREQNQGLTVRLSGDQIRKQIRRMQQQNSRRRRTPGKPGRKGAGQIQRIGKKQPSRGTDIETRTVEIINRMHFLNPTDTSMVVKLPG